MQDDARQLAVPEIWSKDQQSREKARKHSLRTFTHPVQDKVLQPAPAGHPGGLGDHRRQHGVLLAALAHLGAGNLRAKAGKFAVCW